MGLSELQSYCNKHFFKINKTNEILKLCNLFSSNIVFQKPMDLSMITEKIENKTYKDKSEVEYLSVCSGSVLPIPSKNSLPLPKVNFWGQKLPKNNTNGLKLPSISDFQLKFLTDFLSEFLMDFQLKVLTDFQLEFLMDFQLKFLTDFQLEFLMLLLIQSCFPPLMVRKVLFLPLILSYPWLQKNIFPPYLIFALKSIPSLNPG